jgi:hypothetical protein
VPVPPSRHGRCRPSTGGVDPEGRSSPGSRKSRKFCPGRHAGLSTLPGARGSLGYGCTARLSQASHVLWPIGGKRRKCKQRWLCVPEAEASSRQLRAALLYVMATGR